MPENASRGWFRRLISPARAAPAKTNALEDPAVESPDKGLPSASSTPAQQSRPSLPDNSDVETTIEPTKVSSQERERVTSTDETKSVSPNEPTHCSSQLTGTEAAHQGEGYDMVTRDFAEGSPSPSSQQNINGMKETESKGGSEGKEHIQIKADPGEVRMQPPHNPVNNGLIPQGSSDNRLAPHPSKEEELKLEITEVHSEYVIQRVGTWDNEGSTRSWTTSRWKKKNVIGSGGFGTVWLQEKVDCHPEAVRRGVGQLRAVKTVPRDLSQGAALSQELLAFVKFKQFDHLFVKFHGWYEDADNTFIAMEYVENGDLSQYIERSRQGKSASRSMMEVKEITRQILEGLEVLHSKKIYHCDLKPQNILIASSDPIWIKIADFGVSKQAKNTSIRARAGTDGYLAPEIVGCNRRKLKGQGLIPHALDIWSLGCLVYELLAFEPPFLEQELDEGGESFTGVQTWSTGSRQRDLQSLRDYCHDELEFPAALLKRSNLPVGNEEEAFIQRLLTPNPADRPTAAGALQSSWLAGLQYTSNEVEALKEEFSQLGVELDFGEENILVRQCAKENISRFLPKSEEKNILDLVLLAARGGKNKALSRLLESPDCPESVDSEFKKTLLQHPVESGLLDTVDLLLKNTLYSGACAGESSLLYWALDLATENVDMVELILNHASDPQSALLLAVKSGKADMVRNILAGNFKDSFSKNGRERRVALEEAITAGNLDITKLLLDDETNVNIAAEYYVRGRTLLQLAAECGDIEIVKYLLERNANVNAKAGDENGRTALQAAAERGHMDIVKLLLEKKANVNAGASKDRGRRALQGAAGGGHIEVVELLLDHGADVNAKAAPVHGRTALQAAIGGGYMEIIELLLSHNADVNALGSTDQGGRTAIQLAAENGHVEIIQLLLEKNAYVSAPESGKGGRTALQAAAGGGHLEVVKILLQNGTVVNVPLPFNSSQSALEAAAEGGHFDIFELLLSNGADIVDDKRPYYCKVRSFKAAAGSGHINIVKLLLEKIKLKLVHADGSSTLEDELNRAIAAAARGGHLEVLQLLIDDEYCGKGSGFSREALYSLYEAIGAGHTNIIGILLQMNHRLPQKDKIAVAHYAIAKKQFEILQFLAAGEWIQQDNDTLAPAAGEGLIDYVRLSLANGANVEARYNNLTPIQAAAGGGHLDVCILLLDNKANVNAAAGEGEGRTALQAAAEGGHIEVVRLLLNHQAEVGAPKADRDGITALEAAIKSGNYTIARMLLERCADVGILNQGNPLELAARAGHLDLVKLLLDYGANVNGNHPGGPPLYSAVDSGHINVVKLLLDHGADCPPPNHEWVDALNLAASSGRIEIMKLLCERECNYSSSTVKGMMEMAAGRDHFDTVRFVFQNAIDSVFKADRQPHRDDWGKILETACWTAHTDLVQLVLEDMKEKNIHASNSCESVALIMRQAVERGHIHIVKLLLSYGADPALKDKHGKATLQAAVENGDLEMIELLLDNMVHTNELPHIDLALRAAVENGNIDLLRLLLNRSGNININTMVKGDTLLHLAVESGEMDISKFLLDLGADVNVVSESPRYLKGSTVHVTVLQSALLSGHVDIIKLIVSQKTLTKFLDAY